MSARDELLRDADRAAAKARRLERAAIEQAYRSRHEIGRNWRAAGAAADRNYARAAGLRQRAAELEEQAEAIA